MAQVSDPVDQSSLLGVEQVDAVVAYVAAWPSPSPSMSTSHIQYVPEAGGTPPMGQRWLAA
jgi:hypothetical protein